MADDGGVSTESPELAGHGISSTMTGLPCENQLKHVTLQKLNGERVEVTLQHATPLAISVAAMKSLIQNNPAIPHNSEISLILDDAVLQDERTLVDSGVMDGSVLNLVVGERSWLAHRRFAVCYPTVGDLPMY